MGLTCSDHFQPGSNVARARSPEPRSTSSNRPLPSFICRTSSGVSMFFLESPAMYFSFRPPPSDGSAPLGIVATALPGCSGSAAGPSLVVHCRKSVDDDRRQPTRPLPGAGDDGAESPKCWSWAAPLSHLPGGSGTTV